MGSSGAGRVETNTPFYAKRLAGTTVSSELLLYFVWSSVLALGAAFMTDLMPFFMDDLLAYI